MPECDVLLPELSRVFAPITCKEDWDVLVDACKAFLEKLPQVGALEHVYTPGPPGFVVYCRQYAAPAGTLILTHVHKFTHPFIISRGSCMISTLKDGVHTAVSPAMSVTVAGTQRIMYVLEDMVWSTVHVVPENLENQPDACRDYFTET